MPTPDEPTPYVEANLILAAGDRDEYPIGELVRKIRRDLLPGEMQALAKACERLGVACSYAIEAVADDEWKASRA